MYTPAPCLSVLYHECARSVDTGNYMLQIRVVVDLAVHLTRNSSGDEIANVNFLCDDIVHALKIQ